MIEEEIHKIIKESIAQESGFSEEIKGEYKRSFTHNINNVDKEKISKEDLEIFIQIRKIICSLINDIIINNKYPSEVKSDKLEVNKIDFRYLEIEFNKLKALLLDKNEYNLIVKHLQISLLKENILVMIKYKDIYNTYSVYNILNKEPYITSNSEASNYKQINIFLDRMIIH